MNTDSINWCVAEISRLMNHRVEDVISRCKKRKLVDCRIMISMILKNQGHRPETIAKVLNRERTSINHLVNQGEFMVKRYPQFAEKYQTINALVYENQAD